MGEGTVIAQPAAQSFIIKRPRLTKLLDDSGARIILLLAPAGYGKTTLAREWVEQRPGPVAWYRASPSSADLAALAMGIAAALDAACDDHGATSTTRVTALQPALHHPDALARILVLSRNTWPRQLILVIDDYQHIATAPETQEFVGTLVALLAATVVITSRERPAWLKSRLAVYEGVELGAAALSMTGEEARAVLADSPTLLKTPLVEAAQGWPAVIGLAARRARTAPLPVDLAPDLYQFFADDLVDTASPTTRDTLSMIAASGMTERSLILALLGQSTEAALAEAERLGLLTVDGAETVLLHPLLGDLLIRRLLSRPRDEVIAFISPLIGALTELRRWDECLAIAEAIPQPSATLANILERSLAELLGSGRVRTVARWVDLARKADVGDPLLDLADAEVAVRRGAYNRALTLGVRAAQRLSPDRLLTQAQLTSARAAHLADERSLAAEYFEAAEATAPTLKLRATAIWGQFLVQEEQERESVDATLARFAAASDGSIDHELRLSQAQTLAALLRGDVREAFGAAQRAKPLWALGEDPLVRLAALNQYAWALSWMARYAESLAIAEQVVEEAAASGIEFAVNHGLVVRARSLTGLRQFAVARNTLTRLEDRLRREPDPWAMANVALEYARLHLSSGDLDRAADHLILDADDRQSVSTHAQFDAYRGLVEAGRRNAAQARKHIGRALDRSRHVDARAPALMAEAILRLNDGGRPDRPATLERFDEVQASGHYDAIVMGCRAEPALAGLIAHDETRANILRETFLRSADSSLARAAGLRIPRVLSRTATLSAREQEVYELMVQGRTNPEIARTLYISQSTTKVHVRHILEKLGVHSRVEAARAWDPSEGDLRVSDAGERGDEH